MTYSRLINMVQIRVHTTYVSSVHTAIEYLVMRCCRSSMIPVWPCLLSGVTIATSFSARCNLPNLLPFKILHARWTWHVAVAVRAADGN